jgi:DNA modification methylase
MAPSIALQALTRKTPRLRVLDPMMGSGTVLALAKARGHLASGIDIDPLAILIGEVWTTPIDKENTRSIADRVLKKAKSDFKKRSQKGGYPAHADRETKKFIRYWFDSYSRRQLASLAGAIQAVRSRKTRNALWCAFSRLIIAKQSGASLALDLSHSRPHRYFKTAPKKPLGNFMSAVDFVLKNCLSLSDQSRGRQTKVKLGDARDLKIKSNTIDLVLTSPPYLNAIDYLRCSKFSLIWMGKTSPEIRRIRGESIGSEVGHYDERPGEATQELLTSLRLKDKLSSRHKAILRRFIQDMDAVIRETSRVLKPGGKAIFVVGENTIRGAYIRNSKIISALAVQAGLKLKKEEERALPPNRRYLPPPKNVKKKRALNARMRREVILRFLKPKARLTA